MIRPALVASAFLSLSLAWGGAPNYADQAGKSAAPGTASIIITLNPESRVSVALSGPPPPPRRCGAVTEFPVKIINQGFVTAQLEAKLVGDPPPPGVAIDFGPEPLKGTPEELRSLRVTLSQPGPVDITISFGARHVAHDLGGRDRIHFLMRCLQ